MKVILFGASGMVGQGVLRECLLDPDVTRVVSMVRQPTGQTHVKLTEIVHTDFYNFSGLENQWAGAAACFFCLGVSSAGMSEEKYHRLTYDLTMAAAKPIATLNPTLTFIYVSGMGTDSSEKGRSMWARVKGKTENALLQLTFKAVMFRPGGIVPLHGARSKTFFYRLPYILLKPVMPFLYRSFPAYVTTTEQVGRAMLAVAKRGAPKPIMENIDINQLH